MIKLGVTGGIGSGKTVVCEVLRLYGIPVYDADSEAKKLNDTSPVIRRKLTEAFGQELYRDSKLDRKLLSDIIFCDETNLRTTNAIIHPELAKHFIEWAERRNNSPLVAIDAAVLFEAGFQSVVDKIVTVVAPMETRILRAVKRGNLTREQIESRIKNQIGNEEKIRLSDYIIYNDTQHSILKQILNLLQNISHRSQ